MRFFVNYVKFEATILLFGCPNIPCIFSMWGPISSGSHLCVHYWFFFRWSQWCFVKIIHPIEFLYADNFLFLRDVLNMFNVSISCSGKLPHRLTGKSLLVARSPEKNISLKVWTALSAVLTRWLCGSAIFYWLLCFVIIYSLILFDASLSIVLWVYFYPLYDKYVVVFIFSLMISICSIGFIDSTRMSLDV